MAGGFTALVCSLKWGLTVSTVFRGPEARFIQGESPGNENNTATEG